MKKFMLIITLLALGCAYQSVDIYSASPNNSNYFTYKYLEEIGMFKKEEKTSFKDDFFRQVDVRKKQITSQSSSFEGGDKEVEALMKRLSVRIIEEQEIEGAKIYYGFSTRLRGGIILGREKVNIQIVKKESRITVGTPLIVGSY